MRAQSLKTNDMFDSVAAAELEQVDNDDLCPISISRSDLFNLLRRSWRCAAGL